MTTKYQVCVNAWTYTEEGHQTYTDDPAETEGWSVYVRTNPEGGEFDVDEDYDVASEDEATVMAEALAAKYGGAEVRYY